MLQRKLSRALFACFFALAFFLGNNNVFAESRNDLRVDLKDQIGELSRQIGEYRDRIGEARLMERTLKNELWIINREMEKINLEIRETDLIIAGLNMEMRDLRDKVDVVDRRVDEQKALLAGAIRLLRKKDSESLLEIILNEMRFSDFFDEARAFENLQSSLHSYLDEITLLKVDFENDLGALEDKKDEILNLKRIQEFQKASLRQKENENDGLLKETKGEESAFKSLIEQKEKDVKAIRRRLYLLGGSGVSMSMDEAFTHARFVFEKTGVRPAFLLALLKVESEWGSNTGSGNWYNDMYDCYMRLAEYYKDDKYVRRANLEKDAFMKITSGLGLNPDSVSVSKEPSYGCGGAMGPAQFMPTTWLSYAKKISVLTGHNPPSPWNIDDAFMGAAIKLANAGASQQNYDAEWKAAMIYFAGGNWWKNVYRFYGDRVMELAEVIQREVDLIQGG